jgi:predicted polyphosphate/ATP-dependent NAD kinase
MARLSVAPVNAEVTAAPGAAAAGRAGPCVGIIANPVSARDIRRIVANAGNLQISDRVNIVLRLLSTLASVGVPRVLVMPDNGGIRALLNRHLGRERNLHHAYPAVEFLDMAPTSTVDDTFQAARMMRAAGVSAIVVLGGDGTHRAVVRECDDVPIAGLSTGTNNAFPEMREPTLTALAVGLFATGRLAAGDALVTNKRLEVSINEGQRRDIALVDAVISHEHTVGARALWKTDSLHSVYLTFADPEAIGLSAIGGLLEPVGRRERQGLAIELADTAPALTLAAPIAPGMVRDVGIARWQRMAPGVAHRVALASGIVALDGERELGFDRGDRVDITLVADAFPTVDVSRCLQLAAERGLLRRAGAAPFNAATDAARTLSPHPAATPARA